MNQPKHLDLYQLNDLIQPELNKLKSVKKKVLQIYNSWISQDDVLYDESVHELGIKYFIENEVPFPLFSVYEDCSHYHDLDIMTMVHRCQTSNYCIDSVWLANACKLINPFLALPIMKSITPDQSWYIADYGMHCFVTNVSSSEYFQTGFVKKLEKTTDINYKPLVVDFINFPLELGLTYFHSSNKWKFHERIESFYV